MVVFLPAAILYQRRRYTVNTHLSRVESRVSRAQNSRPSTIVSRLSSAFSLVELLVVITILSLIVLALMAVFNTTQLAFRASVTQTDVLEGGRATMDRITADLRQISPSFGHSNVLVNTPPGSSFYYCESNNPVNFYANTNAYYTHTLVQSLPGSGTQRTNVLENFFILNRDNLNGRPTWVATGYAVDTLSPTDLNPLYRFYVTANVQSSPNPTNLYNSFMLSIANSDFTNANWSHLLDGVVQLTVRAYDTNGVWMTNGYSFGYKNDVNNTLFLPSTLGEVGFYMFSNTLPASVEIQLGVLEDRVLQRAASLQNGTLVQSNYLALQAGKVHIFRQRVSIPNADPSAYQ